MANEAGDRDGAEGASGIDRLTTAPDDARQPRLPFAVVGIGASADGLEAYTEFLRACPADAGMAYVLVQHLAPDRESLLAEILGKHTPLPVVTVEDGQVVEPDRVYVIRPGHTLTIRDGRLHLGPVLTARGHGRPVDDFFRSLAEEQQQRAVAVVFSGMGSNGTAGAQAVKAVGGLVIAQEPESAKFPAMPRSLIDAHLSDFILRPAEVPEALVRYARQPYVADPGGGAAPRDDSALGDVLAVLRTRTRHDFAGYRKPTLLRRVRRRMGLGQFASMYDYVRALRQTPAEVTALADDLLIHVTGFFRDPEAWDVLQEKVLGPLAAARPDGAEVRCWVAACATGEEAYTLAILLLEAAEAAGKRFDVKIFATDLAERALGAARVGVFPNGIESEVAPERLARFFDKDDSFYRVKKELRELVVFAPQNVLQDPPFSRLDVASCRNLLIYLEPETQRRVLALLHFGLREGGTLVLGTAESAAPAEGDFEPIDRKYRLFRRVGPTRSGTLDLPVLTAAVRESRPVLDPVGPRLTTPGAAQLVSRALLDRYTPAAVAVDAAGHVVHVHGDTSRFLTLPAGAPTLDLMALANEQVRGAVRVALHRAADDQAPVTIRDGLIDTPGGRRRVEVGAAPLGPRGAPPLYLVTFRDYPEPPPQLPREGDPGATERLAGELERVRNELQGALAEMQTSNEELKASHEEATSLNEELQSTNEELETSKEEMQSLNEELVAVNAQLQAKMGELEATANDLGSLLTSTDIAVLFLDPKFRIRRFTPAVKDLLDLIPSDVGRPFVDLRLKFADPNLLTDARAVLDKLIPIERPVESESGRHYLRRVLPYRPQDNRIDGVVVAFVDVTERHRTEAALAREKEYAASIVETLHEPLLVLNPDLTVRSVNPAFYTHFRVNPAETVGRWVYHLGNGQWDIPALRTLLEEVLPDSNVFNDYEVVHEFETIGRRVMLVNARRLDHVQLILLGIRDVTERRGTEDALRQSEERQAFLLRLSDAIRPLADPAELTGAACRLLAERLDVDRAYFVEVDEAAGVARVERDFVRRGAPALTGEHRVADFAWSVEILRRGECHVVPDVRTSPLVPPAERPAAVAVGIVACMGAPLIKDARLVGALCVTADRPREWAAREVGLLVETAERIWATVERARAETALAAELDAMTRLHALSDRLLAVRDLTTALGDVLDTAITLHAADKGTVQVYDPAADGLRYAACRGFAGPAPAPAPVIGRDSHSTCAAAIRTGQRVVATDIPADARFAEHAPTAAALGYRAAISTPLTTHRGELQGVLTVHFREPHAPTERELRLADLYAAQAAQRIAQSRAEDALRANEELLRAVAANLPNAAVFVVGPDLRYVLAEGEAFRSAGFVPADLEGRTVAEGVGPDLAREYEPNYRAALGGAPFRVEHAAHGRHFITHGVPLRDAAGAVTGVLAVSYDISDRVAAEAGLRRAEERLRLALAAARMGTWTWDATTDAHHRDANLNALLGLPAEGTVRTFDEFLGHVHPDDREGVRTAFDQSVRRGRPLSIGFRVVRPDGTVRWLRDQGDVFGTAGSSRLAGACVDVTDLKEAEGAVRTSEERLRLTLESATDHAIFTLDRGRTVTSWSPGAAVVFGYAAGEIVGRSADIVFTPEDQAAGVPQQEAETARREGRAADERWHTRKDGARFFASGVLTPLGADGTRGFVKVLRDLTERKRMEDALRRANDELEGRVRARTAELVAVLDSLAMEMDRRRHMARRLATAQEDERRRVARDLHDSVGQLLTGLSLAVRAAETSGDLSGPTAARLAEAQRLMNDLGKEVHGLALRLRPTSLDDIGLEAALGQLVAEWSSRTGTRADLHASGFGPGRLPPEAETTVYRIVQEALTNVAKHAAARAVSVVVARPAGFVSVVIEDDGTGFDPEAVPNGRLGLLGMRERVELVGGTIDIDTTPGQGTTVAVQIPVGTSGGES
ncbi:MAG TPA: chemotaxis protein CheB [Gemmata sp.]